MGTETLPSEELVIITQQLIQAALKNRAEGEWGYIWINPGYASSKAIAVYTGSAVLDFVDGDFVENVGGSNDPTKVVDFNQKIPLVECISTALGKRDDLCCRTIPPNLMGNCADKTGVSNYEAQVFYFIPSDELSIKKEGDIALI